MMKKTIFFLTFVLSQTILLAQQNKSRANDKLIPFHQATDIIYLDIEGDKYYKNGITYDVGSFYKKIGKEFSDYPDAMQAYRKSRKQVAGSFWTNLFGGATTMIAVDRAITIYANSSNPTGTTSPNMDDVWVTDNGLEAASLHYLKRAIFLRNEAIQNEQKINGLMK